jgi:hypothetical protein
MFVGILSGPFVRHQVQLPISFGGIDLFFKEVYAPFAFLRSWVIMVLYLCSRFHTFDKPILEEYVLRLRRTHTYLSHAYI